jgi:hypothetical protein
VNRFLTDMKYLSYGEKKGESSHGAIYRSVEQV